MNKLLPAIIFILLCESIGFIGTPTTINAIPNWYAYLIKPSFAPPSWVFAPVWTLLYAMMGIAAFLVWEKGFQKKKIKTALLWFASQLFLNFLWSQLFFGLRSPLFGLICIFALWIAIIVTTVKFWKISRPAGYLMVPYIFWVSFASLLNFFIFLLNR